MRQELWWVGRLRVLHWIGLIGGGAFCLATGWLWLEAEVPARMGFVRQLALTGVMLVVTAYSQFRILPAMEVDRALAGGEVETASLDNAGRVDFERLHTLVGAAGGVGAAVRAWSGVCSVA